MPPQGQAAPFRPAINYAQTPITANTPSLPEKVDLNAVAPHLKDVYQEYNNNIDYLNTRLSSANQQAQSGQQQVQSAYDTTANQAEDAYRTSRDNIQSANQDSQLRNRLVARATGGAPSSGYLDLVNRTDIQSQKDIGQAGRSLQNNYAQANQIAQQALGNIQSALSGAIAQIQQDASLTLRQRDQAITDAKIRASQLASSVNFDDILNSLTETPDPVTPGTTGIPAALGPQVQGAQTSDGYDYNQAVLDGTKAGPFDPRLAGPYKPKGLVNTGAGFTAGAGAGGGLRGAF